MCVCVCVCLCVSVSVSLCPYIFGVARCPYSTHHASHMCSNFISKGLRDRFCPSVPRWLLAVVLQSTLEVVVSMQNVLPTVCQSTLERRLGESDRMLGRAPWRFQTSVCPRQASAGDSGQTSTDHVSPALLPSCSKLVLVMEGIMNSSESS